MLYKVCTRLCRILSSFLTLIPQNHAPTVLFSHQLTSFHHSLCAVLPIASIFVIILPLIYSFACHFSFWPPCTPVSSVDCFNCVSVGVCVISCGRAALLSAGLRSSSNKGWWEHSAHTQLHAHSTPLRLAVQPELACTHTSGRRGAEGRSEWKERLFCKGISRLQHLVTEQGTISYLISIQNKRKTVLWIIN